MNLKDRGNKKWTSLMLVEHKKRLKELKEKEKQMEKPELDDQMKEEINLKMKLAVNKKQKIKLTYFADHSYHELKGEISKIDSVKRSIKITNNYHEKKINLEDIIDLTLL